MYRKFLVLLYGVACYLMFVTTFLYAVGFIVNVGVPRSIDGPPQGSLGASLVVDLVLLTVFALQHSVMARPAFKRWWAKFVPEVAERSTYVLASSLALILLFADWRPLGGTVWHVANPAFATLLHALCALGFLLALISTFLIDHFDLFGLRQAWLYVTGKPRTPIGFRSPGPYRFVRHPLYVGFLLGFWATPTMTMTHLLFAIATTGYILVAIRFEERDLTTMLGQAYRDYRKQVPMLVPFTK